MNRKEFIRGCWINIEDRLPPDSEVNTIPSPQVLVWLPRYKIASVMPTWLARADAIRILEEKKDKNPLLSVAWDRYFIHWMPIVSPVRKERKS